MRKGLGDSRSLHLRHIMAHDDIGECKVGGGAMRKMAHDQPVGLSSVLAENQEVCDVVGATSLNQLQLNCTISHSCQKVCLFLLLLLLLLQHL